MDYQLLPAVGTTDADGITTFTNRPAGAPLFYLDDNGRWVPVAEASPATPAGPGAAYTAGAGIAISATSEISSTDYSDAEVEALLAGKQPAVVAVANETFYGQPAPALDHSHLNKVVEVLVAADHTLDLPAVTLADVPAVLYVRNKSNGGVSKTMTLRDANGTLAELTDGQTIGLALVKEKLGYPHPPGSYRPVWAVTQQPIVVPAPVAAPVVALAGGVVAGFATLLDALNARPSVLRLNADVTLTATPNVRFDGRLLGNGHTITIAGSAQLRLLRSAYLDQVGITAPDTGSLVVVGNGVPSGGTVPAPPECVQVVDCQLDAPLNLSAASAYQGLALRGSSTVSNLASGGGPVYLYDLAEVTQPLPAGFTLYDKRPGVATASAGIDYANPATLTATATLAANTAYYVTGSGYALSLPSASANLGKAIFIEIAATATGLYPVTGSNLTVYARETMLLRATLGGWTKAGGELIPMSVRIETTPAQQTNLPTGGTNLPYSRINGLVGPAEQADLANHAIVVQRAGNGTFYANCYLKNATPGYLYQLAILRNRGGSVTVVGITFLATGANGNANYANGTLAASAADGFAAGDVVYTEIYCGNPATIRGENDALVCFLQYKE